MYMCHLLLFLLLLGTLVCHGVSLGGWPFIYFICHPLFIPSAYSAFVFIPDMFQDVASSCPLGRVNNLTVPYLLYSTKHLPFLTLLPNTSRFWVSVQCPTWSHPGNYQTPSKTCLHLPAVTSYLLPWDQLQKSHRYHAVPQVLPQPLPTSSSWTLKICFPHVPVPSLCFLQGTSASFLTGYLSELSLIQLTHKFSLSFPGYLQSWELISLHTFTVWVSLLLSSILDIQHMA